MAVALHKLHKRDVPKEWEAELAEFSPATTRFTWLKLIWEPGYPWEIVDRFLVYQMVPTHAIEEYVREQLDHPLPPSQMGNYWDSVLEEFVRNPDCLITERAYWLYRETGCWGRPYWVIQGNTGGHRRFFSNVEKQMLKLMGLPTDPPAPGDLAYAPWDNRVIEQLAKLDLLKQKQTGLKHGRRLLTDATAAHQSAQEEAFREELMKWLAEQVTEATGDGEGLTKALMALDAPRADIDPGQIEEQEDLARHNFVKHGRTAGGLILLD